MLCFLTDLLIYVFIYSIKPGEGKDSVMDETARPSYFEVALLIDDLLFS